MESGIMSCGLQRALALRTECVEEGVVKKISCWPVDRSHVAAGNAVVFCQTRYVGVVIFIGFTLYLSADCGLPRMKWPRSLTSPMGSNLNKAITITERDQVS